MSQSPSSDQHERIVEALEENREKFEKLAQSETPFAKRAKSALEWLEEHKEDEEENVDEK